MIKEIEIKLRTKIGWFFNFNLQIRKRTIEELEVCLVLLKFLAQFILFLPIYLYFSAKN